MSTTAPAHPALSVSRLVMRIITPGARSSARRAEQVDGSRVGPVEVFDEQQAGCRPGEVGQPVHQGLEGLGPEGHGVELRPHPVVVGIDAESEQWGDQGTDTDRVEAGDRKAPLDLGEPLLRRLLGVEAEPLLEHAPDRPEGHIGVVRGAARLEDGIALGPDPLALIGGQPRLADARRSTHHDHRFVRWPSLGRRPPQAVPGRVGGGGSPPGGQLVHGTGAGPGPGWVGDGSAGGPGTPP